MGKERINIMEEYKQNGDFSNKYNIFRIMVIAVATVFLLWFIAPVLIFGILIAYNFLGICICSGLIIFYSARKYFIKLKEKLYKKKLTKILWRMGKLGIYAFGVYGVIISIIMGVCACIPPSENSTAILLGAQVRGTSPSLILYDRITACREYLEDSPKAVCVATGGLGDTASITEAQCMYNVLTEQGIESIRIYKEENATNTQENIKLSYEIIKEQGANSNIAIVSDGFHQARARLIARKLGLKCNIGAGSSNTNLILLPTYWLREWFGLPYDAFFR